MLNSRRKIPLFSNMFLMIFLLSGFVMGCGSKEDLSETSSISEQRIITQEQVDTSNDDGKSRESINQEDNTEDEGGGNSYDIDRKDAIYRFDVLVIENEYYYQNRQIIIDELIALIKEVSGEKIVVISDNNASKKAFNKLIERLKKEDIPYEEK